MLAILSVAGSLPDSPTSDAPLEDHREFFAALIVNPALAKSSPIGALTRSLF